MSPNFVAFSWLKFGFAVEAKGATAPHFRQVHGNRIIEIQDIPHATSLRAEPSEADGAFTQAANLELSVFTADCIPLLVHGDAPENPIGVAHCGWRGTKDRIAQELLTHFPTHAKIFARLGPCILKCCFEVREDFLDALCAKAQDPKPYLEQRNNKLYFDLPRFLIETQLSTLSSDRIDLSAMRCTYCSSPRLPSYRRDKNTDPRIRSWIRKVHHTR